ncbi:MAG: LysE family transporter [Acidihalobacter sp.]|jgi:threonine efflux protein
MSYVPMLAGIAAINLLAIMSPGPAFFLVSRSAASRSRAVGVATAMGVSAAAGLWAMAAIFGVALFMTRFTTVYGLMQLVGGAYLIWLGLSAWSASQRGESSAEDDAGRGVSSSLRRAVLTGGMLSLTNPKMIIYFTSIFVAVFPAHAPLWVHLTALGIVVAEEVLWWVLVAYLFSHARMQTAYRRVRGVLDRVLGVAFVAFGARIVALAHF